MYVCMYVQYVYMFCTVLNDISGNRQIGDWNWTASDNIWPGIIIL